jgi:hypothetical protein
MPRTKLLRKSVETNTSNKTNTVNKTTTTTTTTASETPESHQMNIAQQNPTMNNSHSNNSIDNNNNTQNQNNNNKANADNNNTRDTMDVEDGEHSHINNNNNNIKGKEPLRNEHSCVSVDSLNNENNENNEQNNTNNNNFDTASSSTIMTACNNTVNEDLTIQDRVKRRKLKLETNQKEVNALKNDYFIAKDDLLSLKEQYDNEPTENLENQISIQSDLVQNLQKKITHYENNIQEIKDLLSSQNVDEGKLDSNNNLITSLFANDKGIKLLPTYPRYKRNDSAFEFIQKFRTNVLPTLSEVDNKTKIMNYMLCLVADYNQQ